MTIVLREPVHAPQVRDTRGTRGCVPVLAFLVVALSLVTTDGLAAPKGGKVRQGEAKIEQDDNTTNVRQRSHQAVIDWQSFNVQQNETVNFVQPTSNSLTINAIHDARPTEVFGSINANGRVALLNPNGVIFGPSSSMNVGALLAGAAKFERIDADGRLHLSAGAADSVLIHGGLIQASQSVALIGTHLENNGTILARAGSVQLASGLVHTVDFDGFGLIHLGLSDALAGNLELGENSRIEANTIAISIKQTNRILNELVNLDGVLLANSTQRVNGQIVLSASNQGVLVDATVDAGTNGQIDILSDASIVIDEGARLRSAGGRIRVGGSFQGNDRSIAHAQNTVVVKDAQIDVDAASENSPGGQVVVWSDGLTFFDGLISARGLNASVEVSGKNLAVAPNAAFNMSETGELLFDPDEVIIRSLDPDEDETECATPVLGTTTGTCPISPTTLTEIGANITISASVSITVNEDINLEGSALTLTTTSTIGADDRLDFISIGAAITGSSSIRLISQGNITGTGALTAPTITLISGGDIGTSGNPIAANASNTLTLTTTGEEATNIFVSASVIPSAGIAAKADTRIDLTFEVEGDSTGVISLPEINVGGASNSKSDPPDVVNLSLTNRMGGIEVNNELQLNSGGNEGATSTVTLTAGTGNINITSSGSINADTIRLTATAGSIITATDATAANALTAGTISLSGVGIGTAPEGGNPAVPITVNAATSLSLTTTGETIIDTDNLGDIYVNGGVVPTTLSLATATATTLVNQAQTIALNFNVINGDVNLPATPSTTDDDDAPTIANDTLELTFTAEAGAITIPAAFDLSSADTSTITLNAMGGSITGTGVLTANTISLSGTGIGTGTSITDRVTVNAATSLSLTSTGEANLGGIFVRSTVAPPGSLALATATTTTGETVNLDFTLASGTVALPTTLSTTDDDDATTIANDTLDFTFIAEAGAITIPAAFDLSGASTSTITLNAMGGSITGTGVLTANTVSLSGTGIGTGTSITDRVTVNAATSLSLTSTGEANLGGIFVRSTVAPPGSLALATATTTGETVNLNFTLASGTVNLPTALSTTDADGVTTIANDTLELTFTATTGAITIPNAFDLTGEITSTTSIITLNAMGGSITGAGALTAGTISLSGVGIGTSPEGGNPTVPITVNAATSLSLTTTGVGNNGNIFVDSTTAAPSGTLSLDTDTNTGQTVDLNFTVASGNIALPTTLSTTEVANDTLDFTFIAEAGNISYSHDLTLDTGSNTTLLLNAMNGSISDDGTRSLTADTITLNATGTLDTTGNINIKGTINAPTALTIEAQGTLVTGAITSPVSTLTGASIGTSVDDPLTVNATTKLTLTSTGEANLGGIFVKSTVAPPRSLTLATVAGSSETVNLKFTVEMGDVALPTTNDFTGLRSADRMTSPDMVILAVMATDTDPGNGAITIGGDLAFPDETTSTITLDSSGSITGTGVLTADNITLSGVGIGVSTTTRVTANANTTLSLTTDGATSAGDIYVAASVVPATTLAVTTGDDAQTVDLDFDVDEGDVNLPSSSNFMGFLTDTATFDVTADDGAIIIGGNLEFPENSTLPEASTSTITLNSSGSITGVGTLSADTISLSGVGIGTSAASVSINVNGTLMVTSGGADDTGNIYLSLAQVPTTFNNPVTDADTAQTIQLLLSQTTDLDFTALPMSLSGITIPMGDTLILGYDVTGNITIGDGTDIDIGSDIRLRLVASGNIIGTSNSLSGGFLNLRATRIGTSDNRVIVNAATELVLASTGADNPGGIFVDGGAVPSDTLTLATADGSSETVRLNFTVESGNVTLPTTNDFTGLRSANRMTSVDMVTLTVSATDRDPGNGAITIGGDLAFPDETTSTITLTTARGTITGAGALTADRITLSGAGIGIGTDDDERVTANANTALSLTSTGIDNSEGIFVDGAVVPSDTLILATGPGSVAAVNLKFTVEMGDVALPTTNNFTDLRGADGRMATLSVMATDPGNGNITIGGNLAFPEAPNSTITLTAMGSITGTGTGVLTADTISLTGAGIGTAPVDDDTPAVPVTANANTTLNLTTTGAGAMGDIFFLVSTAPSITLDTNDGSSQTVTLIQKLTETLELSAVPSVTIESAVNPLDVDVLNFTYDVDGDINITGNISVLEATLSLTATGTITGIGTLAANSIVLTGASIGTDDDERVTANASNRLTLETTSMTGAGDIYATATTIPSAEIVATVNDSSTADAATVIDLTFNVSGNIDLPMINLGGLSNSDSSSPDVVNLSFTSTGSMGGINVNNQLRLNSGNEGSSMSAVAFTATIGDINITSSGSINADTIRLTATAGSIITATDATAANALTAGAIFLTAANNIGTSGNPDTETPAVPVTANASNTLTLTTTGAGATNIFVSASVIPSAGIAAKADTRIDLTFEVEGDSTGVISLPEINVGGASNSNSDSPDVVNLSLTNRMGGIEVNNELQLNSGDNEGATSTVTLTAGTGNINITSSGSIGADSITLTATTGSIITATDATAANALTAGTISLSGVGIGTPANPDTDTPAVPVTANANTTLNLTTTGEDKNGNIFFLVSTAPSITLDTNDGSSQTVTLIRKLTENLTLSVIPSVTIDPNSDPNAPDVLNFTYDVAGDIDITGAISAPEATLSLTATGTITGTGTLAANSIVLTGASIGTDDDERVTVNADTSLSLTSTGAGNLGSIFVGGTVVVPSETLEVAVIDGGEEVNLNFTVGSGDVELPTTNDFTGLGGADLSILSVTANGAITIGGDLVFPEATDSTITLLAASNIDVNADLTADTTNLTATDGTITGAGALTSAGVAITLTAGGAITTTGALTANTIRLTGARIGTAPVDDDTPAVPVIANATTSLSLSTTGNGGVASVFVSASTMPSGMITVDVGDTNLEVTEINLKFNISGNVDLPVINLGGLSGSTDIVNLTLNTTDDMDGMDGMGDINVNTQLQLNSGDNEGAISTVTLTAGTGNINITSSGSIGADSITLTATTGSIITATDATAANALTAGTISLTGVGIGTAPEGGNPAVPITVNAATSLSLTSTGETITGTDNLGDIYVNGGVVPTTLSLATATATTPVNQAQTIALNFNVINGDVNLPATLSTTDADDVTTIANDTLELTFTARAGVIIIPAAFDLSSATTSTITLLAASNIDVGAALTADTINLTAMAGTITGAGILTANTIALVADGIGMSTPTLAPINANAATSLTLTTDGTDDAGDIYVAATVVPATTLAVTTGDTAQTVDLGFTIIRGNVLLPTMNDFTGLGGADTMTADTVTLGVMTTASSTGTITIRGNLVFPVTTTSTITLNATGSITGTGATGTGALTATGAITLIAAGGAITTTGVLTANTIRLTGTRIGTAPVLADDDNPAIVAMSAVPVKANAMRLLDLTSTGVVDAGDVFVSASVIPSGTVRVRASYLADAATEVDLTFNVSGNIDDLPMFDLGRSSTGVVEMADSVSLTINTMDGMDGMGDINVNTQLQLNSENTVEAISAVTFTATGNITGSGSISASSITLSAASTIGTLGTPFTVNAATSLTLATNGTDDAGNIYVDGGVVPAMTLDITTGDTAQTVDLDFGVATALALPTTTAFDLAGDTVILAVDAQTGAITIPGAFDLSSAATSTINLTATAGTITGAGALTANTIELIADGIGAEDAGIKANAATSLTLTTDGAGAAGNIYVAATVVPTTTLAVTTGSVAGSDAQTVNLDFDVATALALPTTTAFSLAGDTVILAVDAQTGAITIPGAFDLSSAATSTINLTATAGTITGAGALTANTIELIADGIGAEGAGIKANAATSLTLTTDGTNTAGNIYLEAADTPAMNFAVNTDPNSAQFVELGFSSDGALMLPSANAFNLDDSDTLTLGFTATTGDINLQNDLDLSGTASLRLTAEEGNIVGAGILTANTIALNADGIGMSTPTIARVNVNAATSLTLTTDGAADAGDIYVAATVVPTTTLAVTTKSDAGSDAGSDAQTVDLDFNVINGDVNLPTALSTTDADGVTTIANDTLELTFTATTGAITIPGAFDLSSAATSTIDLLAASNIDVGAALTADTINLTATAGTITGAGILTADTIALNADGIGMSTPTIARVNVNAATSLTLATDGAADAGDIYVAATVVPTTTLAVTTKSDAGSNAGDTAQTVNLDFDIATALALPTTTAFDLADDIVTLAVDAQTGAITIPGVFDLSSAATSTITLLAASNIDVGAALMADTINLTATAGTITGAGILTADTIALNADGIGMSTPTIARVNVNAATSLTLATDGAADAGDIYVAATVVPTTTLAVTTGDTAQTVDLDFDVATATVPLPTTTAFDLADDIVTLAVEAQTGAITIPAAFDLRSASTSTITLLAASNIDVGAALTADTINLTATAGTITGAGILTADTIALNADGIGMSTPTIARVNVNAATSLTLATDGAAGAGDIYVAATVVPATTLAVTTGDTAQTVDLDFDVATATVPLPTTTAFDLAGDIVTLAVEAQTGAITIPGAFDLTSAATSTITLVAMGGSITGAGVLTADTISLTGTGIGVDSDNPVIANADTSLSLTSTGAANLGGIFVRSTVAPPESLALATATTTGETVNLNFTLASGDFNLPATLSTTDNDGATTIANDTLELTFTAQAGAITIPGALDLSGAATSSVTATAATNVTGDGDLTASTIELTATSGDVNIAGSLGTATSEAITVIAGGNITSGGALIANDVVLSATGIGVDDSNRVSVAAVNNLSLTTTGSGSAGDIYTTSSIVPSNTLTLVTDTNSAQTANVLFDVATGNVVLPAMVDTAALSGDVAIVSVTAGSGAISNPSGIDLSGATTSTINLTATAGSITGIGDLTADTITLMAASSIDVGAALTADTITLTATAGTITGTGALTADTIALVADGIGTSVIAVNTHADDSLTLTTDGTTTAGNIYVAATVVPATTLAVTTGADAQIVNLTFTVATTGNVTVTETYNFDATAGDTVTLTLQAMAGDILIDSPILLPKDEQTTSTVTLLASGAVTSTVSPLTALVRATTLVIDADRVGPTSASVIGQDEGATFTLENDSSFTRLRVNVDTLNISNADYIYFRLEGDLLSGNLIAEERISINPNGFSVGNVMAPTVVAPENPANLDNSNPVATGAQDAGQVLRNTLKIGIDDSDEKSVTSGELVSIQASRLYVGAPTNVVAPPATTPAILDRTTIDTSNFAPGIEVEKVGSVALLYTPTGDVSAGDALRVEYVNSVRDFVISSTSSDSSIIVGEIGLDGYQTPTDGSPATELFRVEDVVIHNFASMINGYAQLGGNNLISSNAAADNSYTFPINLTAVSNFNAERLYLYTSTTPAANNIGAANAPFILDRASDSVLGRVSGSSETFFFGGGNDVFTYLSDNSADTGSVPVLLDTGVTFDLSGEAGQVTIVSTVSSFKAAEDFSLFVDTSVFLTFDLVVYSDEANATCTSFTFEEPEEGESSVEGCI